MHPERRLKILILGLNYAPEQVGIAVYTTGLAEALVGLGHQVEVVAGKPYYPTWTVPSAFRGGWKRESTESGVRVTRVAHYVPSRPTGLRRILHHLSFAVSSFIPTLKRAKAFNPDVVLSIAPSLIAAPVASFAARVTGAKSWLHVQDFEVEAAMATGLVRDSGLGSRLALRFERKVIGLFHQTSSISPAMCQKLVEKGVDAGSVTEFRNWVDIGAIKPLEEPSLYREDWGITTEHVALYSGNIANKQGIEIIVEAARRLQHRSDLTFVVCGEGPNRENLQKLAHNLTNIRFHDLQPIERLNELLGLASVHLLPQRGGTADLVLPSKLTGMLASGRPVIATAIPGTGLAREVEGCGIVTPPDDEICFAKAIEYLLDAEEERQKYGRAARQQAKDRWEKKSVIGKFSERLFTIP